MSRSQADLPIKESAIRCNGKETIRTYTLLTSCNECLVAPILPCWNTAQKWIQERVCRIKIILYMASIPAFCLEKPLERFHVVVANEESIGFKFGPSLNAFVLHTQGPTLARDTNFRCLQYLISRDCCP